MSRDQEMVLSRLKNEIQFLYEFKEYRTLQIFR